MRIHPLMLTIAFAVASAGCTAAEAAEPSTRPQPATRPVPVAAIWFERGYPPPGYSGEMRKLIVGLWSDGTIVWSAAEDGSGKPYQSAKLDPAAVAKLIKDLDEIQFFTDEQVNHHRNRYPPDAGHTVLAAESGPDKQQRLALWRDPPADRFGEVWTAAKKRIEQLRPAEKGEPLEQLDESVFRLGRNVR
jgi:hypothetical protein